MKVVIPAAGKGMRLRPLTFETPKPLLAVGGKSLLHRLFEVLPDAVDEAIVIIGYKSDRVISELGETYLGRHVSYIDQREALGTGHALTLARAHIAPGEKVLYIYSDNLYQKDDLTAALRHDLAMLIYKVADPSGCGVVVTDTGGRITAIHEKSDFPPTNMVAVGAYVLDSRIFDYPSRLEPNGEYYINSMLEGLMAEHHVFAHEVGFWIPVGTHEEMKRAEALLRESAV